MEVLDIVFIGLLSLAILCIVFTVVFLILAMASGKKLKALKNARPKKKKKRMKWRKLCSRLEQKRKKQLQKMLIILILACVAGGGAVFGRYYQATNLGKDDSKALIQGYFLLTKIEEQMDQVQSTENPKAVQQTIYDLSARLANYGARSADGRLSEEGQQLLNRLYVNMKELGLNMGSQTIETLSDPIVMESYTADLKKTKENQSKVFNYFRINEKSLNEQM